MHLAFKVSRKATRESLYRNIVGLSYREWFPEHNSIDAGCLSDWFFSHSSGTQLLRKLKKKTVNDILL